MPTGYTSGLYDGPEDFNTFVMKCARAFGALIDMRDEPLDKPIPDIVEPGLYHLEQLNRAKARLEKLNNMQAIDMIDAGNEEANRMTLESKESYEREMLRYQRFIEMREQVRAWTPPTPDHENLKKFMLKQLEHDCRPPEPPKVYKPRPPEEWFAEQKAHYEFDIAYHTKQYAKDVAMAKERTEWVQALKRSLLPK